MTWARRAVTLYTEQPGGLMVASFIESQLRYVASALQIFTPAGMVDHQMAYLPRGDVHEV